MRGYYGSDDDGMDIARNAMGLAEGLGGLMRQGQQLEGDAGNWRTMRAYGRHMSISRSAWGRGEIFRHWTAIPS